MLHKMHHKLVDITLTGMSGLFGWGLAQVNVPHHDEALKFAISTLTALFAGGMGYVGKLLAVWLIRKFKSFSSSLKNKTCKHSSRRR